MARIKLASYLRSISGTIDDVVYYNYYNREYGRAYVKPTNPDTHEQRLVQGTFGDAVRSWQKLSAEEKDKYNKKARRLPMSGYNLYISQYMKQNITLRSKSTDTWMNSGLSIFDPHKTQKADPSVASPFLLHNCFDSAPIPPASGIVIT